VTGLDTNVLIRFLTEDDTAQARKAADLIESVVSSGEDCYISPVVLCELAWVLLGPYAVTKTELLRTLDQLLATSRFALGDKDVVRRAVEAYRTGGADFADYVIGALHADAGCGTTATFDRRLRGDARFRLL
jgi:predicted nucleic-acid-binding protein